MRITRENDRGWLANRHGFSTEYAFVPGINGLVATVPVTQQRWQAVMTTTPWCHAMCTSSLSIGAMYPAYGMTVAEIEAFCKRISNSQQASRLLTADEWDIVSGVKNKTDKRLQQYVGDLLARLENYAWFRENTRRVREVGMQLPNPYGLYDTYGNCWELCKTENANAYQLRGGTYAMPRSDMEERIRGLCHNFDLFSYQIDVLVKAQPVGFRVVLCDPF